MLNATLQLEVESIYITTLAHIDHVIALRLYEVSHHICYFHLFQPLMKPILPCSSLMYVFNSCNVLSRGLMSNDKQQCLESKTYVTNN